MKTKTAVTPTVSGSHHTSPFFARSADKDRLAMKQTPTAPFFSSSTIQAKLTVGQPDDPYEREADTMAEKVVQKFGETQAMGHRIQQKGTVQKQVQKVGEELGQSSTGSTRHLVSDLSSPITIGSQPRYELMQQGAELWAAETKITYRWTVTDLGSGNVVYLIETESPETRMTATVAGNYRLNVTVLGNGSPAATSISMDQRVVAENAALSTQLAPLPAQHAQTYRELVNDFRPYIIEAANATGPLGITPLFLASVLFIEVLNRPKEGREDEIAEVGSAIGNLQRGSWNYPWQKVDRSVGVGQIRLSTAAMATGVTPWVDQDRNDRDAGREQAEDNFAGLNADRKAAIFRLLKWPKSNIRMAATLLARLKNRNNRFPAMDRATFVADEHAVGVVASEYNLGPSSSTAAESAASWYGQQAWDAINADPILIQNFPNN